MKKNEQKKFIGIIKKEFGLMCLRPFTGNRVNDERGFMQINRYNPNTYKLDTRERTFLYPDSNSVVMRHRWDSDDRKDWVIRSILFEGNNARCKKEVGYCLIEVVDSNVFTKDEFDVIYNICKKTIFNNEELYERLITAMLKEIKKDKESIEAWCNIAHGFSDRISLCIWQENLQPHHILTGKTSQEEALENLLKEALKL